MRTANVCVNTPTHGPVLLREMPVQCVQCTVCAAVYCSDRSCNLTLALERMDVTTAAAEGGGTPNATEPPVREMQKLRVFGSLR